MSKDWKEICRSNNQILLPRNLAARVLQEDFCFAVRLHQVETTQTVSVQDLFAECCLFDASSRQVFGRPLSSKLAKGSSFLINEALVFYTNVEDSNIHLLVQIAGYSSTDVFLLGWSLIPLLAEYKNLSDVVLKPNPPLQRTPLYKGSPRCLFLPEVNTVDGKSKLRPQGTNCLTYTLQAHVSLNSCLHLIPENTLIGSSNLVPGLQRGDTPQDDFNFQLKPTVIAMVDQVTVMLGSFADRLEEELCVLVNRDRLVRQNKILQGESMRVSEQRLQIGVHNGWTFTDEPAVYALSVDSGTPDRPTRRGSVSLSKSHNRTGSWDSKISGSGATLRLRNRVEIADFPEDAGCAIVFLFEAVVVTQSNEPNPQSSHVLIGWAAWSPFAQAINGGTTVTVPLMAGSVRNPAEQLCFKHFYALNANHESSMKPSDFNIQFQFSFRSADASQASYPSHSQQSTRPHHPASLPLSPQQSLSAHTELPLSPPTESSGSLDDAVRKPVPPPPPRQGRTPLEKAIRAVIAGANEPSLIPQTQPSIPTSVVPRGVQALPAQAYQPGPNLPGTWHVQPYPMQGSDGAITEVPVEGLNTFYTPILALQSQPLSSYMIPRGALATLSRFGFPPINDRHGEVPELVDAGDMRVQVSINSELADPLSINEIVIQFMAFARGFGSAGGAEITQPASLFFTFQFYRFQTVTTDRLILRSSNDNHQEQGRTLFTLHRQEESGALLATSPGFQVKFVMDPFYLKPGEQREFVNYLASNMIHIDAWDADSLLLIGSAVLPLRCLLRTGREAVQAYCELPLVTTEMYRDADTYDSNVPSTSPLITMTKGRLFLKMACVGYPQDVARLSGSTFLSRNQAVIVHALRSSTQVTAGGLKVRTNNDAQSLLTEYPELRLALLNENKLGVTPFSQPEFGESEERKRKLQRAGQVRVSQRFASLQLDKSTKNALNRDIQTIQSFRERRKHQSIISALYQSVTTVHTIYPTLGKAEFFEFLLQNPLDTPAVFLLEISDTDLRPVTDTNEWHLLKQMHNLSTPLEKNMFGVDRSSGDAMFQVFLRPREAIYIPLKYQTFMTVRLPQGGALPDTSTATWLLQSKTVRVAFKEATTNDPVAFLVLCVEPQPQIVNQSFRFYHPEDSVLTKYIRVPDFAQSGVPPISAASTDPKVLCNIRNAGLLGQPQDVFLKVSCGASPQVKGFSVMLYADPYKLRPIQSWQVYIHVLQKVEITTTLGQINHHSVVIKGSEAEQTVCCFSSSPSELRVSMSQPFLLQAGVVAEVDFQHIPQHAGERSFQVNAVDVERRTLIKTWLVCTTTHSPAVVKAYLVTLPVGPLSPTQTSKRLQFKNPYSVRRQFHIRSSDEHWMMVKTSSMHLQQDESGSISLRFASCEVPTVKELLLFITNEQGTNEETFGVKVVYTQQ